MYRPAEAEQMTTPMLLQAPTGATRVNGALKKTYTDVPGIIYANYKTYGGTERQSNDVYVVDDTADIVCWYRPDIKSDCRIKRIEDGAVFDIVGEPEDLERRHMFLKFKIRRVKGGV